LAARGDGNDTPLIDERAATRGHGAMEGGAELQCEELVIRLRSSFASRIARREPRPDGGHSTDERA
jgi:hypothetical protein